MVCLLQILSPSLNRTSGFMIREATRQISYLLTRTCQRQSRSLLSFRRAAMTLETSVVLGREPYGRLEISLMEVSQQPKLKDLAVLTANWLPPIAKGAAMGEK
jgi:hypothetical protein